MNNKTDFKDYNAAIWRAKKLQILFATDLVSRELDINDITCIINFDLPRSVADYIHRIGRTARAGKNGWLSHL